MEQLCIGTIAQLREELLKSIEAGFVSRDRNIDQLLSDLHKPFVDEIILVSPSGKPMYRVPDLIDVWFDSGAMPYAQWGLPDTSSNQFGPLSPENFFQYHTLNGKVSANAFPASFIAEGVDQTRGWFYTLHAIASLLFDSVAYKTVVSNGLVLDKNGNKMSKRLGNVVDPFQTIESFGADATRWYLITNKSKACLSPACTRDTNSASTSRSLTRFPLWITACSALSARRPKYSGVGRFEQAADCAKASR